MTKYNFENIPLGKSFFYQVGKTEAAQIRKNANYWTMKAATNNERLSCHNLQKINMNLQDVFLGIEVFKLQGIEI